MAESLFSEEPLEAKRPTRVFYNIQMAKALRNIKPPYKGIIVDVKTRPNYLALIVYEKNIMEFDTDQRVNIMEYLLMMREIVESFGVRCELEGSTGNARRES